MDRKRLSAILTACFALSLLSPAGAGASVGTMPAQVSLATNHNPSVYGQSVTFTAKVTPEAKSAPTPEGTVAFVDGSTTLGVVSLNAKGIAMLSTKSLETGEHRVVAEYGGDAYFGPTSSAPVVQRVAKATTELVLKSSRNPSVYKAATTLTATLKVLPPGSGTPAGSITFLEDGSPVATVPLEGKKVATYSLKGRPPGTNEFQAVFSGDASYEASESTILRQIIAKATTEVTLKSSRNPAGAGTSAILTATVKVLGPGAGIPTGDAVLLEEGMPIATLPLPGGKQVVKYSLKGHLPGGFEFKAIYGGDSNYTASESAPLIQLVAPYAPEVTSISPSSGPESGGSVVSIEGQNLAHATEVKFGSAPAQPRSDLAGPDRGGSPSGNGTVDVTVTTPGGVSASSPSDEFSYLSPPSVTSISPSSGPESGGALVKITGTGFTGATAVTFASDKWGDAEGAELQSDFTDPDRSRIPSRHRRRLCRCHDAHRRKPAGPGRFLQLCAASTGRRVLELRPCDPRARDVPR